MDGDALKDWLVVRLTSDRASEEWQTLLEAGFEQLLDEPFEVVIPRDAAHRSVLEFVTTPRLAEVVRPAATLVLPLILASARADDRRIGRWVSPETEARIIRLAERDEWIDPAWVEAIYQLDVAEELVADTLYRTLRDFSTIIPRIVLSVMPSPLGKLAKLGGKATGGLTGRVVEEVERRVEAEIKKYLEKGTRRALDRAARFTIEHVDDAPAKAARRDLTKFVLERSGRFHTRPISDEVARELDGIAVEIAEHVAASDETKRIVDETTTRIYERFEGQTLRATLAEIGVAARPPYDAWAAASWPAVGRLLVSPGIDAWLVGLCTEIVAEVAPASTT